MMEVIPRCQARIEMMDNLGAHLITQLSLKL